MALFKIKMRELKINSFSIILIRCYTFISSPAHQKVRAHDQKHHLIGGRPTINQRIVARAHHPADRRARHARHELDGKTQTTARRCAQHAAGSPKGQPPRRRTGDGRLDGHHHRHGVRIGRVTDHRVHVRLCDRLDGTHLRNK